MQSQQNIKREICLLIRFLELIFAGDLGIWVRLETQKPVHEMASLNLSKVQKKQERPMEIKFTMNFFLGKTKNFCLEAKQNINTFTGRIF